MTASNEIQKKYEEKIKKFSQELAEDFLQNESNLIDRFTSFDTEVQKVLIEVGKSTMKTVGDCLEDQVKKKRSKQD